MISPRKPDSFQKENDHSPDRKRKLETSFTTVESESKKICSDQESNSDGKQDDRDRNQSCSSYDEPPSYRKKFRRF